MVYSDFTLKKVKAELHLTIQENPSIFSSVKPLEVSKYLTQTLARNIPLALAINSEKARSELIIINVLLEVREQLKEKVSLFSGIDFSVDKDQGLTGFCDYIISASPEQLYLESPVITIVEAKNENIIAGLGQCIAEMYAASLVNQRDSIDVVNIYGAVTTGDEWKFLHLAKTRVQIDLDSYYISDIEKILGILVAMVEPEVAKDQRRF